MAVPSLPDSIPAEGEGAQLSNGRLKKTILTAKLMNRTALITLPVKTLVQRVLNAACEWFKKNGFTLPLSMLVIYDSYIHSGGILTQQLRSDLQAGAAALVCTCQHKNGAACAP
jgi:hypothetical protein